MQPQISASIMCSKFRNLEKNIRILEDNHVEWIHWDLMDGNYVPNIVLPHQMMDEVREITNIPLDIHFMHRSSEEAIKQIKIKEGDQVMFHLDNTAHPLRLAKEIRDKGAHPGVVLQHEMPIWMIEDIVDELDFVQLMSVPTGMAGAPYIPGATDKLRRMRKFLSERGLELPIQIDGCITLDNAGEVLEAGANVIVAGYYCCYDEEYGVDRMLKDLRAIMSRYE